MSKEVPYLHNNHNIADCPLPNNRELKPFKIEGLSIQEKGISEESSTQSIIEQPIGCKIIASRLHHLEQGQKRILRTIASLQPIVQSERMAHSKKGK